jgi:hypothetical protein
MSSLTAMQILPQSARNEAAQIRVHLQNDSDFFQFFDLVF